VLCAVALSGLIRYCDRRFERALVDRWRALALRFGVKLAAAVKSA
jgi:hypothetical protein